MTAKEVLTEIYQSKELAKMMQVVRCREDLKEDLKQHVFCELFAKPEEFILDLVNRGKLKGYISSMVFSISRMKNTNSFARQFGLKEDVTDSFTEIALEVSEMPDIDTSRLYWYKDTILRLYAELGTYKAVSLDTGIPVTSIYRTVNEARKELKREI